MTSPAAEMPMPTPIAIPDDFPVQWQDPMEGMLLWEREHMHFPRPVSTLVGDLMPIVAAAAFGPALASMGAPLKTMLWRRINTYFYQAGVPDFDKMAGAEAAVKQAVADRGFTMYQTWENEMLPRIEALSNEHITTDYDGMSDAEMSAAFDRTIEMIVEAWKIHFELLPGFYTATAFKGACQEMFGFTGLEAYEMMQGVSNLSVESGSKLWQLAQSASQEVKDVIKRQTSLDALETLRGMPSASQFLADFDAYLQQYGWRSGSFDVFIPSWIERPDYALDQVRLMLRVKTDPAEDQRQGFERAEAMANECRAKLAGAPEALGTFDFLLGVARNYPLLQENHNFYLDQKFMATVRRPVMAIGRRLASKGVIADAEDVGHLLISEVKAGLAGDSTVRTAEVAERKAEMAHFDSIVPPLALGSRPPMDNPDPFFGDFFGKSVIEPAGKNEVKGTASSRGKVTGTARVILNLRDSDRVEDGDILVCEMTTPAWTPLFASLGAIVSDSGGPLSHCAVVAREYGVPCVTGTRIATSTIPDGATITVDGDTGLVTIHG